MEVPQRSEWHKSGEYRWTRFRSFVLGFIVGVSSAIVISMIVVSRIVG